MKKINRLGIWMDHSSAHLMEYETDSNESGTITSKFTHQAREESLGRSENIMQNKEQHQQSQYFKKLGDAIKNYDEVLIFGPTDAKAELHNILKTDHHFDKIKIDVEPSGKMSENEQHAFVAKHFSNK